MATSRKNIPDDMRKKIIVMAAEGYTTAEIMKATGQTAPTISKVCRDANIRITRKQCKQTEGRRDVVLDLFSKGYTPTEITIETGIPVSSTRTIIRDAKIVTFRNAEKPETIQEHEQQQLTLNSAESTKEKRYEALLMIREAINMLIEANISLS